jgi:ribosome-binding factor A
MPAEFSRSRRVAAQIQRELAPLVQHLGQEQGLMITVTAVELTPDLRQAKVFLTSFASERLRQILPLFKQASPEFRHQLGHSLRMRGIPDLMFRIDESFEQGARIAALLDAVKTQPPATSAATPDDPDQE